MYFNVAESEDKAIEYIRDIPGMRNLPIKVKEISEVDGYTIVVTEPGEAKTDKQEVKPDAEVGKPAVTSGNKHKSAGTKRPRSRQIKKTA